MSTRDGTLWLVWAGTVLRTDDTGQPRPVATPPGDPNRDLSIAALSADSAVVVRGTGHGSGSWYRTDDRGGHWHPVADPCAQLPAPGAGGAYLMVAPDRTQWTVCFTAGGATPGWWLTTSTDEGRHWTAHLATHAGGDDIIPVSATVAWRTGSQSDLYRTTDAGDHWTVVATTRTNPIQGGAVIDADTALYLQQRPTGTDLVLHVTHDGGHTWH